MSEANGVVPEYPDTTIEAREKAIAAGMTVIEGGNFCLLLDLDSESAIAQYRRMIPYLKPFAGESLGAEEWKSKSGNLHVRIPISEPLDAKERIALQCMLGSDLFHEYLALRNIRDGHEFPIMLFRPAEATR